MLKTKNLNLYDYFLHFNAYTQKWNLLKREDSKEYLNGTLPKGRVKSSKSFKTLINSVI